MEFTFFIFWLGINALIGFLIGNSKNAVGQCVFLSILLGPIGWLICALLPGDFRKCPFCAENMKPEAKVCPHCQRDIPKAEPPLSPPPPKPADVVIPAPPFTPFTRRQKFGVAGALAVLICLGLYFSLRDTEPPLASLPPESTPAPPEFVRLTSEYDLINAKGRVLKSLEPGKRLRVVARYPHDLTVDWLGEQYNIPAALTEPSQ
jgi:hypothetical protein